MWCVVVVIVPAPRRDAVVVVVQNPLHAFDVVVHDIMQLLWVLAVDAHLAVVVHSLFVAVHALDLPRRPIGRAFHVQRIFLWIVRC